MVRSRINRLGGGNAIGSLGALRGVAVRENEVVRGTGNVEAEPVALGQPDGRLLGFNGEPVDLAGNQQLRLPGGLTELGVEDAFGNVQGLTGGRDVGQAHHPIGVHRGAAGKKGDLEPAGNRERRFYGFTGKADDIGTLFDLGVIVRKLQLVGRHVNQVRGGVSRIVTVTGLSGLI